MHFLHHDVFSSLSQDNSHFAHAIFMRRSPENPPNVASSPWLYGTSISPSVSNMTIKSVAKEIMKQRVAGDGPPSATNVNASLFVCSPYYYRTKKSGAPKQDAEVIKEEDGCDRVGIAGRKDG